MKRFVSLWLPYLVTDWFALKNPGIEKMPFVIKTASHNRMIVSSANMLAESKGITTGITLADARAIYPALQSFDEVPGIADKILQRLAEWCIRFSPITSVDPFGGVVIDATGCAHLWGSDKAYLSDIIRRIQSRGFHVKAAMADTIGAAWAVARFRKTSCVIHTGKHVEALQTFPPESLRFDTETTERLHKLGLHQVRDILGMKGTTLRRRFGYVVIERINQAVGTAQEFITPVIPVEPYIERLPCLEPIARIEGIEIALQRLLESLCKKLISEGKGARELVFRSYRIDNKQIDVSIGTSAATTNVHHLFKLFEQKLSSIEPALGIELFTLEATKFEDHQSSQEEIWKQAGGLTNNKLSELIDRLSIRIGTSAIFRYLPDEHYLPERSFKKTLSLKDVAASGWKIERPRPVQLLSAPERIEVTAPVPDYPPLNFRYKGKLHKIIKADGPERIEQEWWIYDGQHRDYYAVQDEEGGRYWLFRSGHYDAAKTYTWFIHGIFA
jgi:protein ImuB